MKKIFLILLSAMVFASCDKTVKSAGAAYELVLVCEDDIWNSSAGQALEQALDTPVPGLPQQEATFKVTRTGRDGFKSSLQTMRNIIVVDINSSYSKCEFRFQRDMYASPQIVMGIYAPDIRSFGKFVNDNAQTIVDFFTEKERERQVAEIEERYNKKAMELMREVFGCELKIPSDIAGFKRGEDFLWLSDYNNPSRVEMMSFAVYSYPYTSPDNFSKEHFIHKRDSVMKINIQGAEPSQYIQTTPGSVTLTAKEYNGKYMSVARGLWHMENDDMFGGGPFVAHSIVDEENGRMIVVEAFVYAPNKEKRNYMRKLEASLYTLKLPADLK